MSLTGFLFGRGPLCLSLTVFNCALWPGNGHLQNTFVAMCAGARGDTVVHMHISTCSGGKKKSLDSLGIGDTLD